MSQGHSVTLRNSCAPHYFPQINQSTKRHWLLIIGNGMEYRF